ncbi:hypothetical protein R6Q57_017819 [Mikania cordata]
MSYARRSRYSPSPSPPHKRYSRSVSKSRSRSRSRSYDASDIENPGNSLYVTGLSRRVTKKDLEKHFSAEGKIILDVVVGPLRILLIQEAALLVTHPKDTVAGPGPGPAPAHTLHMTVGAHTRVLPLRTVDEDLTVQKTVTTGGEVVTTLRTLHQTTEGQAGAIHTQTTHLSIGDGGADVIGVVLQGSATITGATADDIVVFLEACLVLQGGIKGVALLAGRRLGRGGGFLQTDLLQGAVQVSV